MQKVDAVHTIVTFKALTRQLIKCISRQKNDNNYNNKNIKKILGENRNSTGRGKKNTKIFLAACPSHDDPKKKKTAELI